MFLATNKHMLARLRILWDVQVMLTEARQHIGKSTVYMVEMIVRLPMLDVVHKRETGILYVLVHPCFVCILQQCYSPCT